MNSSQQIQDLENDVEAEEVNTKSIKSVASDEVLTNFEIFLFYKQTIKWFLQSVFKFSWF